jgi:hypothetical protein
MITQCQKKLLITRVQIRDKGKSDNGTGKEKLKEVSE